MSIHSQSRQQLLRTGATMTAAGVVAYVALVHGGSIVAAQSGARPVAAVAADQRATAPTPATASSYSQMDDYVETLIWWRAHPDWMPDGICD